MTVEELIEALKNMPQDKTVTTEGCCHHCMQDIDKVTEHDEYVEIESKV